MEEEKHILEKRFTFSKRTPKHPEKDDLRRDAFLFDCSLIVALAVFLIIALISRSSQREVVPYVPMDFVLQVEDVPETNPGRKRPPPPKMPAVPIPSEMEEMLEEMVLEVETLDFVDLPDMPTIEVVGSTVSMSPRPYFYKWPDYPESEQKKGHQGKIHIKIKVNEKGIVEEHEVILNTTKSKVLERLAVEAAMQSKFFPARDRRNNPIAVWTVTKYSFGTEK